MEVEKLRDTNDVGEAKQSDSASCQVVQLSQTDAPGAENVEAEHAMQVDEPGREYVPARQS